jgi:predicted dehydrogenase
MMKPEDRKFSRRDFVRGVGGLGLLAGFPTIIPASAFGANDAVRIGHIGVKNRGMQNLKPLIKHAVAVCDVDKNVLEHAKEAVEKQGRSCKAFADYRRLLDDKEIDAVVVSTPDHWHAQIEIDSCAAGKDVYCEKPLSLTIDEGKAMVAAARKHNRIVQTGSQQRSEDQFRLACELVRSGRIGKVHTVKVGLPGVNFDGPAVPDTTPPPELDYNFWLGPAPDRPYNPKHVHYLFRFFWDYSGGQMTNFGAHHLDIAQWGLNRDESGPVAVEATATFNKDGWFETPESSRLVYTYDDGVKILCEQGKGSKYKGGCLFEGDKGTIFVSRKVIESKPDGIAGEAIGKDDVHLYVSKDHYQNWLDCIKSREKPICDVAIGHRSATVCHLGNIAIRLGRPIRWDPVKEQVIGDTEAASMQSRPYRAPWKLAVS